jgi:Domain of unknown function (DUF5659)
MSADEFYKTSDLALASYLKLNGLSLTDIEFAGGSKAMFVFLDTEDRQKLLMEFYNHQGSIDPLDFLNVFKSLKGAASEIRLNNTTKRGHFESGKTA